MSGGRIIDFFEDGDEAHMSGGRIGRVNMKLDDNLFDMSGGIIDGNLVTGFGSDRIILSNGTIGGNISVSGGVDEVTVTGGSVGGSVLMSFGADSFIWDGGGIIYGAVDLGGDDDTASLTDLTNANIGATTSINGGLGTDGLTLDNVSMAGVARLQNWETIDATDDTELTFDGDLLLGDSVSGTGTLTVDATSTLFGGDANVAVRSITDGLLANVVNSGRIDLTNGGSSTSDRFTIVGDYEGDGGLVLLQTELGDDSSASDRLVISNGTATGTTGLSIVNVGGHGAVTVADGIMVVQATDGGQTDTGAFALDTAVAAGAYEYFLFKGGVSAGTEENWYLRSTLVAGPIPGGAPNPNEPPPGVEPENPETAPPPPPPVTPPPPNPPTDGDANTPPVDDNPVSEDDPPPTVPPPPPAAEAADPPPEIPPPPTGLPPLPFDGATPPNRGATPVIADVVPLYRIEVPTYAPVPALAHYLSTATVGTFHERRGEQSLLDGAGNLPAAWGRVFGQDLETEWDGTVDPSFDGRLYGIQAGLDLIGLESDSGHRDRLGILAGYADIDGDIKGQALGWNGFETGSAGIHGTNLGAYWTHIGPRGWYLDAVALGTFFGGDATSNRGVGVDVDGTGLTLSLEGGYPIVLTPGWTLEPQAQVIWNHLSLDDAADRFSTIDFDTDDATTGRLGARLQGNFQTAMGVLQPYLNANLWRQFDGDDSVSFDSDEIVTERGGTAIEVGGGIVAQITDSIGLYATANYTTNLGGDDLRIIEGNAGINVRW
jgi:type V secretory pathway adhesin AidA